jgi:hypothetical protein
MKKSIITFLKPDWRKIVLFVLMMGCLNYLWISSMGIQDSRELFGLPIGFYPKGSFMITPEHLVPPIVEFSWLNFILDIFFWYLIACLIFSLYDFIKNKRKKTPMP